MTEPYDKYNGCVNCPYLKLCSETEVENGGYAQAGYTPQDEYGECPEDLIIKDNTEG